MIYSGYQFCIGNLYAIIYFPTMYWLIGSEFMHTGGHNAFTIYPIINKSINYVGFLNCQYHVWNILHTIGHHQFTNILDKDFDLNIGTNFKIGDLKHVPGYRTHEEQEKKENYKVFWQQSILYIFPSLVTFALSLGKFQEYLVDKKIEYYELSDTICNEIFYDRYFTLLINVLFIFCYPLGILQGLFALIWAWNIHSFFFTTFTQISHLNEHSMVEVDKYKKKKDIEKVEWAIHQMLTTTDYSPDSLFARIFSINLNYQIVHHLFPSIHPVHFPDIRKLLIPIAKKYDIDYEKRSSQTFCEAITNYYNWIYKLNEDDTKKVLCIRKSYIYGIIGTISTFTTTVILPYYLLF